MINSESPVNNKHAKIALRCEFTHPHELQHVQKVMVSMYKQRYVQFVCAYICNFELVPIVQTYDL